MDQTVSVSNFEFVHEQLIRVRMDLTFQLCCARCEEYCKKSSMNWIRLPADFKDRPRLERWWAHVLILVHRRPIKFECCESFRKGKNACKGCPTLYRVDSPNMLHRFIARVGKRGHSHFPGKRTF